MSEKKNIDFREHSDLLLVQLKSGDRKAFTLLFDYYYTGLVVLADRYLHDLELSEDIVQSVFVRLWENRQSIQSSSIRYYLSNAVKNNCIDLIRKKETQEKYVRRQMDGNVDNGIDFWAETELEQMIEKSIANLPPRCAEIFRMSRFDGLKTHEIAEKLHLSNRTVETQISNALKVLRKDLKDYLFQIFFTF